jgi:serine/threonine protein kinase/Flp pilus assembly protein TadD
MPAELNAARDLFLHAVGKLPPEEWDAYVAEACGGDAELKHQVELLLRVHREAGSFLDQPAAAVGETAAFDPEAGFGAIVPGTVIGPYKLLQQIGEGGMGTVFMAEQTDPVRRTVAVKVIKAGMDSRQVIARFEAERQALAMMDHVNIARVLDTGATASGLPYFVMELVHGVPITKYCDDNHLTPRERLELFVPVCQAVQHAHQKGIIHRDVKPSNVMVTLYDGKPVPKVIDFGVAKATEQKLTERTLFTQYGTMVGTFEYMSPEQAEMSALGVDTRSDIYSLGVLLYELLTGSTPLTRKRLKEAAYAEILRMIREEEPPRPSTRLSDSGEALASISANRQTEPARLTKLVRGELDWIVMRALEKDRNRRYETANGFAQDVQNYLADEPVLACPPTAWYRFRKFVRRNKPAVGTAAAVFLAGLVVLAGAVWHNTQLSAKVKEVEEQQRATRREADRADANFAKTLEAVDKFLSQIGHKRLAQVPGMEQVRREVLEEALQFFQGFLQTKSDEPSVRREAGWAYFRAGLIQNLLGRHDAAERSYRRAVELLGQLAVEFPGHADYRRDLANCYSNLAMLLQTTGRTGDAELYYRKAMELSEQLAREHPDVPEHRRNLARSYKDMGPLLKVSGQPEEAERYFRRAIELQEKLATTHPAEADYREDLALSLINLALLLKTTGRPKEAEAAYRRCVDILEKLTADSPAGAECRFELAGAHLNLGVLLEETNRAKEAELSVRRSIELAGKLAADFPTVPDYRSFLAKGQINLAGLLRHDGRPDDAMKSNERALELLERLVADHPQVPDYRRALAGCLNNVGEMMYAAQRLGDAETRFGRMLEVLKVLVTQTSGLPADRSQLASGYYNLAILLGELRRDKEAEAALGQARELFEKLVADLPTVINHRHMLGAVLNNLSMYVSGRGDLRQSRLLLEQAVEHQNIALASNPRHPVYRLFLANHYRSLADVLMQLGDHSSAASTAAEAPRLYPKQWGECLRAAEVLARCAPLAEKDGRLAEGQRTTLAKAYADQSVAWLRQAVDCGCRDLATPTKPAAFDPLRSRADFQELIKGSEQGKPEVKKPLP